MLDTTLVTFIHVIFAIFFVKTGMFHTCYLCNILMRYMMIFPFYRTQKLRSSYLKYFSQLIKGMYTQDKSQISGNQCISTELLDVYHSRTDFNMRHNRTFCKYYKLFCFFKHGCYQCQQLQCHRTSGRHLAGSLWSDSYGFFSPFDSCQK